ncbi:MAG: hypothetical protein AB8H80_22085 [Planctomycetota bacterium]
MRTLDTYDYLSDPRDLTMAERHRAKNHYDRDQTAWLAKLRQLAEAPLPDDDFPAFLLATQPFAELAKRLGRHESRQSLPVATADELDWFLRAFADYLRTQDGEDVFSDLRQRMTG